MPGQRIVSLEFDDGFRRSCEAVAGIYERFGLSASFSVLAAPEEGAWVHEPLIAPRERGDFNLWNRLRRRGHCVMPHGYKHADKSQLPLAEAQALILACLRRFERDLEGFQARRSLFAFPYNRSTPPLEAWMPGQVGAFRVSGEALHPLPAPGLGKLTCGAFGPGNCEADLNGQVARLLARSEGWLIYNLHGLDFEGWGPVRTAYLEELLARLLAEGVQVVPAARVLVLD